MNIADIAFQCPLCSGPLITEVAHAGQRFDCPHCYHEIEVPAGETINKNQFQEPQGLRRLLREVRDREWENMRRELRTAKARNAELEAELGGLRRAPGSEPASDTGRSDSQSEELSALQTQVAEVTDALAASREKHGITLDALRSERERSRAEAEDCRAAIQAADAVADELRKTIEDLEARLDAEQAKVFLMEAAGGAGHLLPLITLGGVGPSQDSRVRSLEEGSELSMGSLDSSIQSSTPTFPDRSGAGLT